MVSCLVENSYLLNAAMKIHIYEMRYEESNEGEKKLGSY